MIWGFAIAVMIIAYLLGSISSSIIISKIISGKDIRESGSGNAGATNMLRTHGKKAGILTLLCDMLKGVIAISFAMLIGFILTKLVKPSDYIALADSMVTPTVLGKAVSDFEIFHVIPNLKYIAALFVVLGHIFPIFFGFKGGKGIATSGAVVLMLNWKIGLIITAIALIVMIVTRYVSLGSVISSVAYPLVLGGYLLGQGNFSNENNPLVQIGFAIILAFICTYKHKENIKRLLAGTESKLGQKKKTETVEIESSSEDK